MHVDGYRRGHENDMSKNGLSTEMNGRRDGRRDGKRKPVVSTSFSVG